MPSIGFKDFLQVEPICQRYHFTNEYLQVVKQFATQEMPRATLKVTKSHRST
jgi:hypothetical protein